MPGILIYASQAVGEGKFGLEFEEKANTEQEARANLDEVSGGTCDFVAFLHIDQTKGASMRALAALLEMGEPADLGATPHSSHVEGFLTEVFRAGRASAGF